jgi:cysteine synthase
MSVERVALLKQLGAKVVLTPGILMNDAVARAEQIEGANRRRYP